MAYSLTNPPMLVRAGPLTGAGQTFLYRATDVGTAVDAAGFITNAKDLGMRVGDVVLVLGTTAYLMTSHTVVTVSATGADLSDGVALTSTTNSD